MLIFNIAYSISKRIAYYAILFSCRALREDDPKEKSELSALSSGHDADLQLYPSGLSFHTARCKPTEEWAEQLWPRYRMQTTGQSLQNQAMTRLKWQHKAVQVRSHRSVRQFVFLFVS